MGEMAASSNNSNSSSSSSDPSPGKVKLFQTRAHEELGRNLSTHLHLPIGNAIVSSFSNGETRVEILESVRGADVFILSTSSAPVNDHLMETLIFISACKGASASRITVLLPSYPYARQDKKERSRASISARLVADMLVKAGANRVISIDLHAGQIQGFFSIPVDNLYAEPIFVGDIRSKPHLKDAVIVSPDAGGVKRAKHLADKLNALLALIYKERSGPNRVETMMLIGEVKGKNALIVDDMVDTGGTLVLAAKTLRENGALRIFAFCTHAVLSGPAVDRLNESCIEELVVTDTLPLQGAAAVCKKIRVVSIAGLLASAVKRTHENSSLSFLFDNVEQD